MSTLYGPSLPEQQPFHTIHPTAANTYHTITPVMPIAPIVGKVCSAPISLPLSFLAKLESVQKLDPADHNCSSESGSLPTCPWGKMDPNHYRDQDAIRCE